MVFSMLSYLYPWFSSDFKTHRATLFADRLGLRQRGMDRVLLLRVVIRGGLRQLVLSRGYTPRVVLTRHRTIIIKSNFVHLTYGIKQVLVFFLTLPVNLVEKLLCVRPRLGAAPAPNVRLHLVPVLPINAHCIQKIIVLIIRPTSLTVDNAPISLLFTSVSVFSCEWDNFILFGRILVQVATVDPLV